jgi:pyruvate kinase
MGETEQMLRYRSSRMSSKESESGWSVLESVMLGAAQIARRLDARMVAIASSTPDAALVKSKQRDFVPTVCLSENEETARHMSLYWGIIPLLAPQKFGYGELPKFVIEWAQKQAQLHRGDRIVIVLDNEFLPDVHDTVMVVEVP